MSNVKPPSGFAAATVLLSVALIGCGNSRSKMIEGFTEGNIKKMSMIYNFYTNANGLKGPTDEAQLRKWLASEDCNKEKMMRFNIDVEKIDDYFVSERTGEKFEIRWGVNSRPMGPPRPVVFEATAVDGIRQVGLAGGGQVLDVDTDKEYDELMSGVYVPSDYENYPNRGKKK